MRLVCTLALVATLVGCGDDEQGGPATGGTSTNSAGASSGGVGGAAPNVGGGGAGAATAGAGAAAGSRPDGGASSLAGTASGGAPAGGAATGGLGGQSSVEEIRQADYLKCDELCYLGHEACPDFTFAVCASTCRNQADTFASAGRCGLEHYRIIECYTSFLRTAESVACTPEGPVYMGCETELVAYNKCLGQAG